MSMLHVIRVENYSGKTMVSTLVKGFGRDIHVTFYHPLFQDYVTIRDENDANEFLSSVLILGNYTRTISAFRPDHLSLGTKDRSGPGANVKYSGDVHGHVDVSFTGKGLVGLAASGAGLWNISQKQKVDGRRFNGHRRRRKTCVSRTG